VRIQPVSDAIAEALGLPDAGGALVNEVTMGGPAAEAGLKEGDVVLPVDGETVTDPRELVFAVADEPIGAEGRPALLRVFRDGAFRFVAVSLTAPDGG
jgi:serine protease Do